MIQQVEMVEMERPYLFPVHPLLMVAVAVVEFTDQAQAVQVEPVVVEPVRHRATVELI
jgi:hypothetical protein